MSYIRDFKVSVVLFHVQPCHISVPNILPLYSCYPIPLWIWSYWSDCVLIWMMLGENVIAICPRETYMPKRRIAPTKDCIENIIVMQILPLQKPLEQNRNKVSLQKPIYHVLKIAISFQNKTYQLSTTLCWTEFEFSISIPRKMEMNQYFTCINFL